jgi:hypothetical protein
MPKIGIYDLSTRLFAIGKTTSIVFSVASSLPEMTTDFAIWKRFIA